MTEYVRKDQVLEIIKRTSGDYAAAWAEVNKLPSADVAPVVWCKDCRHFHLNMENDPYCNQRDGLSDPTPNSFCSLGERAVNVYPNVLWTHHADMLASHVAGV